MAFHDDEEKEKVAGEVSEDAVEEVLEKDDDEVDDVLDITPEADKDWI